MTLRITGAAPATTAQVFVGVGAVLDLATGDIDTDDAIGFEAEVTSLTLALVTEITPAAGTTPAVTKKYTGLEIEDLGAELVGIDGLIGEGLGGRCLGERSRRTPRDAAVAGRAEAQLGHVHRVER